MTALVCNETFGGNGNASYLECDAGHMTTYIGQSLQKWPDVVAHACSGSMEKLKRRSPQVQDMGCAMCYRTTLPRVLTLPHKNTFNMIEIIEFNFPEIITQ